MVTLFLCTGLNDISAQTTWSAKVYVDNSNCSCGEITSSIVEWEIRRISDNQLISNGQEPLTDDPQTIEGDENIVTDTHYRICVRVKFFAGSINPCCSGTKCEEVDGQELIDGVTLNVTMY